MIGTDATARNITIGGASTTGLSLTDDNWSISAAGAGALTTLDTGQGANELYDMDQNVLTSSSPTFSGLTLSSLNANNNVVYATVTTGVLAGASTSTQNLCLISGASAPTWGTCDTSAGSNLWNSSLGAIYPGNSTVDLLVGGTTTASAKFAVLNINSGTPTASISAGTGTTGGAYLSATGTLATTNKQTLTL